MEAPNALPARIVEPGKKTGQESAFPPSKSGQPPQMANVLSQLILDVKDLDSSLRFYSELLNLPVRRRDDWDGHRLAYLGTGATEILLLQQPLNEQNPLLDRSGGLVINFHVTNLPAVAHNLENQNVTVLRGLEMAVWGERTFLVADPDGYAVLLSEPVGTVH
jgi:lactoylglutathione lyase